MSTEETRYYLNGVYFHVASNAQGSVLRAVATDGHRLAQIDESIPDDLKEMPGVIVPRKTVGELRAILESDDTVISISVSETKIRFQNSSKKLWANYVQF